MIAAPSPDQRGERAADGHPDPAAGVLAEQRHQTEEADPDTEPERAYVEEVAAREQQPTERDERDREDVGGPADDRPSSASASHEPTAPPSRSR